MERAQESESLASLFRFPDGRRWMKVVLQDWLKELPWPPIMLVEPFLGGSASLIAVSEKLASNALFCEMDASVLAVWKAVFSYGRWIAGQVREFEMSETNVQAVLQQSPKTEWERGFLALINVQGESGQAGWQDWDRDEAYRRLRILFDQRDNFRLESQDGWQVLNTWAKRPYVALFVDLAGQNGMAEAAEVLMSGPSDFMLVGDLSDEGLDVQRQWGLERSERGVGMDKLILIRPQDR